VNNPSEGHHRLAQRRAHVLKRANPFRRAGLIWLLLATATLVGCKSGRFSEYVSPRVTGRVLDADTRQPLADARVRRALPDRPPDMDGRAHGGQLLERTPAVRTDQEGRFVLESVSSVALFKGDPDAWYSVTLSFEHDGYRRFQTNYTLGNATNLPSGEPCVMAGDILLNPSAK
jgi:hypothetical protein